MKKNDFNIISSVKIIEELKANLIIIIGDFFKLLTKGTSASQKALLDCISGAIIILYVLARRFGYEFSEVDNNTRKKLKEGIALEDQILVQYPLLTFF